ncbi:hypothetical protein HPB50_028977 [Hyalomma asiaticum]|nr:hypothetical protein HPB50_028977 [Hyalomma asiaticum]
MYATSQWHSDIGISLQTGGIPESLTARSFLRFLGRLRGVPEWQLGDTVESLLALFDLTKKSDETCYTYTNTDKRKLSIAAAFFTMPPVVLLDEPYAGLETSSKKLIARILKSVTSLGKVAVLLATSSMDDCEMACDRVAVLSKGEILAVGTVPELKEMMARGYTIQFVLHRLSGEDAEVFKNYVDLVFSDLKLRDVCQNTIKYNAVKRIVWREWFEKVAVLEKAFTVEHVYISETLSTQVVVVVVKKIGTMHVMQDIGKESAIM